jgi:hypothetical protein
MIKKKFEYADFYDGQKFTAVIKDIPTTGEVSIEDGKVYLCQNDVDGSRPRDPKNLRGFKTSYIISPVPEQIAIFEKGGSYHVENLVLSKPTQALVSSDLVRGEYYHLEENGELVFQFLEEDNRDSDRPKVMASVSNLSSQENFQKNSVVWITGRNCRPATAEEIFWLQLCVTQDRFIPKDEALKLYENAINLLKVIPGDSVQSIGRATREYETVNKEQDELIYDDFYHGQRFTAMIEGIKSKGKITIQDEKTGSSCRDKHGYEKSYTISPEKKQVSTQESDSCIINVKDLKIERNPVMSITYSTPFASSVLLKLKKNLRDDVLSKYIKIEGLEDKTDPRIFMNYMDELSFVDFSRTDGNPIFEVKSDDTRRMEEIFEEINAFATVTALSSLETGIDSGIKF